MMRTGADEAQSPKYSHVERERRWLIASAHLPALPTRHVLIEDHYLTGTRFRLRRMTDSMTGAVALKLAKKYQADDPTARPMVNAYLSEAEYAAFRAMPARSLAKRRYDIGGFSLDLFAGVLTGLVLAEIEALDADALHAVVVPAWASCEVSYDARFQGGALVSLDAAELASLLSEVNGVDHQSRKSS